jgi:hypothetical protein
MAKAAGSARLTWTRFVASDLSMGTAQLTADAAGNLYFGTSFAALSRSGSKVAVPEGAHAPGMDVWLVKMTPAGEVAWLRQFGGSGSDALYDIEALPGGRLALAFGSESPDFPGLGLADHRPTPGKSDAIVTVVNASDGGVLWSRSFGGSGSDVAASLAAGPAGSIVVGGSVVPTEDPNLPDADDTTSRAQGVSPDVPFAAVLGAEGSTHWFRPVLPREPTPVGQNHAAGVAVAVGRSGQVAIAGWTSNPKLPTTAGVVQPRMIAESGDQGFVFSFRPNGAVAWGSYLGGHGDTTPVGVQIAGDGTVAVVGTTLASDFPRVAALQRGCAAGGVGDVFVSRLVPNGRRFVRSTCWGGSGYDFGLASTMTSDGTLLVTGQTGDGFPAPDRCQGAYAKGLGDAFVLAISADGRVRRALAFGGGGGDQGLGVAAVPGGVAVGGWTNSKDFPGARPGDLDAPAGGVRGVYPALHSYFLTRFTGV